MLSNLIFILSCISYIALVAVNLYKPKGTGDQLVGWGFILFAVMAAYVICSLILTLHIALKGKFDWISESGSIKYVILGLGWLCLMAGAVYSTMINADWQNMGTANWLGIVMVRYGGIWIPLLTLVPFAILLNNEWYQNLSPTVYKIPLLAGCVIGLAFHFLSTSQSGKLFKNQKAVDKLQYDNELKQIGFTDSIVDLLYYMHKGTDPRLTQAALDKLKRKQNLESELVGILDKCDENYDYLRVIAFLENNRAEKPQLFIKPLNKAIFQISEELKYRLQSFSSENPFLELLNVDGLCNILSAQFESNKEDFTPNMLKIKAELDKEPKPEFLKIRNTYRSAVKNYLDKNSSQQ